MIDSSQIPEPSRDEVIKLVQEGKTHRYYSTVTERANIMRAWYNAKESGTSNKSSIIRRSPIESNKDYLHRLKNFDILPFEYKFIQTQQRIYDENNVQRTYPNKSFDFWEAKEDSFDDCGDSIVTFFRDKVLFTKEVEGFGAICIDLATHNGEPLSYKGSAIPYPYIVQAGEVKYYENWYGHLKLLITAIQKGDTLEWRALTPHYTYVFANQNELPVTIPHSFGRTPAILLKGAVDPNSGFKVGMPRRWNITGLYLATSELFYDLKKASMLFGHPIPAYSEDMIRMMPGTYDEENQKYIPENISAEVGMAIIYPTGEPPKQLFYQADMQGLQHLREVIFGDMINLIYQLAQVRDKSKVVHNASGRSKQFDSVEEQGLLAQTATDMEGIERWVFETMAAVRGESFKDFNIIYSKHHNLSSAEEMWAQYVEGQQYGGVPNVAREYQITEYLRMMSSPPHIQEDLKNELETQGFPISKAEIDALKDKIDGTLLLLKTRPELTRESARAFIKEQLGVAKDILSDAIDNNEETTI